MSNDIAGRTTYSSVNQEIDYALFYLLDNGDIESVMVQGTEDIVAFTQGKEKDKIQAKETSAPMLTYGNEFIKKALSTLAKSKDHRKLIIMSNVKLAKDSRSRVVDGRVLGTTFEEYAKDYGIKPEDLWFFQVDTNNIEAVLNKKIEDFVNENIGIKAKFDIKSVISDLKDFLLKKGSERIAHSDAEKRQDQMVYKAEILNRIKLSEILNIDIRDVYLEEYKDHTEAEIFNGVDIIKSKLNIVITNIRISSQVKQIIIDCRNGITNQKDTENALSILLSENNKNTRILFKIFMRAEWT